MDAISSPPPHSIFSQRNSLSRTEIGSNVARDWFESKSLGWCQTGSTLARDGFESVLHQKTCLRLSADDQFVVAHGASGRWKLNSPGSRPLPPLTRWTSSVSERCERLMAEVLRLMAAREATARIAGELAAGAGHVGGHSILSRYSLILAHTGWGFALRVSQDAGGHLRDNPTVSRPRSSATSLRNCRVAASNRFKMATESRQKRAPSAAYPAVTLCLLRLGPYRQDH
jgi:hypothetical protein